MSHFAKIGKDNIVTEIVVTEQDFINSGKVGDSFLWVQTSYNNSFRKQYAGIGYTYDKANDVFIKPKPYASWSLDSDYEWQPPVAPPSDWSNTKAYEWNETNRQWEEV